MNEYYGCFCWMNYDHVILYTFSDIWYGKKVINWGYKNRWMASTFDDKNQKMYGDGWLKKTN